MRGICKQFDQNVVLKGVDFCVRPGEIHALIGENGAGKSTLMNILGGVLPADAGEIRLDGQPVRFAAPADSLSAGVAFIHQELNLVNDLAIYENMFIGRELKMGWRLDAAEMCRRSREVFERIGLDIDPRRMVRELDASYKQIVEIARALLQNASVIIMDEPTTSLTEVEIARVFDMMRTLSAQGVSIVFISHKLKEVLTVCDCYTVLRDGQMVAHGDTRGATTEQLAYFMVGHEVSAKRALEKRKFGRVVLEAKDVGCEPWFRHISFPCAPARCWGSRDCWETAGRSCSRCCSARWGGAKAWSKSRANRFGFRARRARSNWASAMCRATERKTGSSRTSPSSRTARW